MPHTYNTRSRSRQRQRQPPQPQIDAPLRIQPSQFKMRKHRGKNCYRVFHARTQRVYAKCTTKEKALAQMNILQCYTRRRQR